MSAIKKYVYQAILTCYMLCTLSGCDRQGRLEASASEHPEGVTVCFTAQYAGDGLSTRGATAGKTDFEDEDVIHIAASFYEKTGETGERQVGPVQYCAYKYKNGDWKSIMENAEITWPYACDFGRFTAYYISGSNGALNEGSDAAIRWLSEWKETGTTDDTGPMIGTTETKELPFGHTVNLVFTHLCTRLSITNLDASTVSEYWLTNTAGSFHNAYQLKRDGNSGLKFEWIAKPDDESNSIYIARSLDATAANGRTNTVTFYLEPGDYSGAKLNFRNNRSYLTLNSGKLNGLKAGHSYVLDITKDKGIVFDVTDDDGWNDPDNPKDLYELKDIPAFLRAAGNGESYEENGTSILESTRIGVILLRNLDFNGKDPLSKDDFPGSALDGLQSLNTSVTFDGDFHYILNSVRPLFNEIQGRLYNLGINRFNIEGKVDTSVSGYGGLSRSVSESGAIGNVRISNLTLNVSLPNPQNLATYYIGCVAGFNAGNISDIGVRNQISITVKNIDNTEMINAQILVGGIIGQNGGTLSGCSDFDSSKAAAISVTNQCISSASMSTGGVVGYSFGNINNAALQVKVDASASEGTYNNAGGMAGRLRSSNDNIIKEFTNISVQGSVQGGQGRRIENGGNGKSFTGGVAGRLYNYFIKNCNALCDVTGWQGEIRSDVRYATGGAFGCIATLHTDKLVFHSTWYGSGLKGSTGAVTGGGTENTSNNYVGTFAGIIPTHRSDDGYKENGNVANEMDGIEFSGIQLDDEDTSSVTPTASVSRF